MKIKPASASSLLALIICGGAIHHAYAGGVVTQLTQANLKAAAVGGGQVTFSVDGVIIITSPLLFTDNTTIDATGHDITLDAMGNVRLAAVFADVTVNLKGLKLYKGADRPAPGNAPARDAFGGGIV